MSLRIDGRIEAADGRVYPGRLAMFRKVAPVLAVQVGEPFVVDTEEGRMDGSPGDWLCVGPAGEAWPIRADIFAATYRLADATDEEGP